MPRHSIKVIALSVCAGFCGIAASSANAQATMPQVMDPELAVRVAASGLELPIGIAFLGARDWLVIEKNSGRVQHVVNGVVTSTALDLAVNNASERGLLGIVKHPRFSQNGYVYLFWSCRAAAPPANMPFVPTRVSCPTQPAIGADSGEILETPLLGNRVDRFKWDGSRLVFDKHIISLRSFQNDAAPIPPNQGDEEQPERANHNGGVIRFGADGKLYVLFGDQGRRGRMQNLPSGPTLTGLGPMVADDQFGGPGADNAHFSGVIMRLNDDGTTPVDNPFYGYGRYEVGGDIGHNIARTYAYGIRNSFGMAFDPYTGNLWDQENGEDAYDEINRIERGMNSGWIQLMGPASRIDGYKRIETTSLFGDDFPNLQQFRWGPERIANGPINAFNRMYKIPGSVYSDPEFSFRYVLAPAGLGFLQSDNLGRRYRGDLFLGFATPDPLGGPIFRFNLSQDRKSLSFVDPRLRDKVMDNATFHSTEESESLVFGTNFGIVTDIRTGPNGNLYVVSLANGTIYEVYHR
jgi:glucose/arabinose dehydrogenase